MAYGRYCQDQGKKCIPGQKGTPFSRCLTALAEPHKGKAHKPAKASRALSEKRAKGQEKTLFRVCLSAAKKLTPGRAERRSIAGALLRSARRRPDPIGRIGDRFMLCGM
jgi:hypothetical protein